MQARPISKTTEQDARGPQPLSLSQAKPAFVGLLAPIQDRMVRLGVHPDQLTLAALPIQLSIAIALVGGSINGLFWLAIPVLGVLLMAVNALDGSIARATGTETIRGALTNELVDRAGDIMIFSAAFAVATPGLATFALVAVLSTELCAAISSSITHRRDSLGPMSKPDRMLVLGIASLVAVAWQPALSMGLLAIGVGSVLGSMNRVRFAFSCARSTDDEARP
ncbi:MAG: CDP-alcohol phosphatidyltransferase family protein [Acidimicrobiia bacterium]